MKKKKKKKKKAPAITDEIIRNLRSDARYSCCISIIVGRFLKWVLGQIFFLIRWDPHPRGSRTVRKSYDLQMWGSWALFILHFNIYYSYICTDCAPVFCVFVLTTCWIVTANKYSLSLAFLLLTKSHD